MRQFYVQCTLGTGKTRNEEMGNEETEIGNGVVSHVRRILGTLGEYWAR